MDDLQLRSFLNDGIKTLGADALRLVARRPGIVVDFRRMAASFETQASKRAAKNKEGLNVPPFLIASITRKCNLGCAGCYAAVNGGSSASEMETGSWARLFREAEDIGISFILLAGGEPLERMDVIEEAAMHPHVVFPVFTNGCRMSPKIASFFGKRRNLVPIISIEGGRLATDSRRGEGMYDNIMRAMDAMRKEAVFFGVSITVTKDNLPEICSDEFLRTLRKKGSSVFIYVEYVPADGISGHLAPGAPERARLAGRVEEAKKSVGGIHICFPGDEDALGGCLAAGRGFVHINPAGGVEPCPFSPFSDCSIAECSLADALGSPFLEAVRSSGAMQMEHLGGCALWNKKEQVEGLIERS